MIQKCYFCHQVYGEKEPLENKEETSGECALCHFFFSMWYALWKKGAIKETATVFILECRKTLGENHKETVVQNYLIKKEGNLIDAF
jgi:hypothetical protein